MLRAIKGAIFIHNILKYLSAFPFNMNFSASFSYCVLLQHSWFGKALSSHMQNCAVLWASHFLILWAFCRVYLFPLAEKGTEVTTAIRRIMI